MSRSTSDLGPVVLELGLGPDVVEGAVPPLHGRWVSRCPIGPKPVAQVLAGLLADRRRFVLRSSFHFLSIRGAFFFLLRESLLIIRES